jgi:hypothetical protein
LERGQAIVETTFAGLAKLQPSAQLATPEAIARFHQLLNELERLSRSARERIKAEVVAHPERNFVRPDGKVLAMITKEVERLSKSSVIEALGKREGEAMLDKLRELGALTTTSQHELHAIDNERVSR